MAAAKVMILAPDSHLHPSADNPEQLLVILRGAVHMATSETQSNNQQPDAESGPLQDGGQPHLDNQTDAASLQTSESMQSHDQAGAKSSHMQSETGQGPAGRAGQAQAGQLSSGGASSSHVQDRDILDARGCAFALPGLLLGSALDVHVTAKTVVEAYSIPWSLIQVGSVLPCCMSPAFTCHEDRCGA